MAKNKGLNAITDTPEKRSDLTQDFMLAYIKHHGTAEDKAWYVAMLKSEKYVDMATHRLKIKEVRNEFADRFFPNLKEKRKNMSYVEQAIAELTN